MTLPEMQDKLAALKEALYSGALSVRYGDMATQFRSVAELREAIALLEGEIAKEEGTTSTRGPKYNKQTGR